MKYYDLTNKELLNAYNASTEYDEAMCCEICTRVGMHTDYYYADGESMLLSKPIPRVSGVHYNRQKGK